MNAEEADYAHPGFVEIIKNLCPDDAKIMQYLTPPPGPRLGPEPPAKRVPLLDVYSVSRKDKNDSRLYCENISLLAPEAKCTHTDMGKFYIENLCRLKLLTIKTDSMAECAYDALMEGHEFQCASAIIKILNRRKVEIRKKVLELTNWGWSFTYACIAEHPAPYRIDRCWP